MEKSFSFRKYSLQEFNFLYTLAKTGKTSLPVYSADVAVAFQIRHRFLKDCIEQQYRALQSAYGKKVHRVKHKRSGYARAMNGYILPFEAVMQLLYQTEPNIILAFCFPAFLHFCFSIGSFKSHLN